MSLFGWTDSALFRDHFIPFLLVYYAPVLIGAYRRTQGKAKSAPVWVLFLVCVLTGWTVIGWLYTLRLAFRSVELPWDGLFAGSAGSGGGGGGGSGGGGWTPPGQPDTPPEQSSCMQCGGYRSVTCPSCHGRGSWWEGPQTADGVGSPAHCSYCTSSGKVTCGSCGGSGKAR